MECKRDRLDAFLRLLKEWIEDNTLYYDDEKDELDPTKERVVKRPEYISLRTVKELLEKAVKE